MYTMYERIRVQLNAKTQSSAQATDEELCGQLKLGGS